MAQSPFQVDALQIEPGSGDTLTVGRDSTAGAMKLVDAVLTAGVLLPSLVGMRAITGVYVVGRAGDGAAYTTIQAALDAIPDTSSTLLPSIVWVLPGVYTENVTLQKDGVFLCSPGGAKITNSGAAHTVTISASLDTVPLKTVIRGMEIESTTAAYACIKVDGADTFASGTVTVVTAPLAAGDTLTINGTVLTGIAGTRAAGSNNFSTLGSTITAVAAELTAAINDALNGFATTVKATAAAGVVTIQAITAGSGGNAITLATSTTPSGGITLSGATLSGGSASGSLVLSEALLVEDTILIASGAGGYQINASTANDIWVRGGTWRGSSATSTTLIADCASFRVSGLEWANDFNLSYDTANDVPANTATAYQLQDLGNVGDIICDLASGGALVLYNNPVVGGLTLSGTQAFTATRCGLGTIALDETVAATLSHCSRGALTLTGGAPTIDESRLIGSAAFSASASEAVAFDISMSDASFTVLLDNPGTTAILAATTKAVTGFTIAASASFTGTVGYVVVRDI